MAEQYRELNLLPSGNVKSTPAFATQEEYEIFCNEFKNSIAPDLEKYRIARINSEIASRSHFVD